jgi:very-short-patch-repair endonuclease
MKTDFYNRNMFYGADSITLRAAAILRKNMTLAELILWKKLKDRKIFNTKFRRQHPVDIFIVDFYCHEYKLAIEIDGEIHKDEEINKYDLGRTYELKKFGIKVIRFTNDQIVFNIDQVITRIHGVITELAPL